MMLVLSLFPVSVFAYEPWADEPWAQDLDGHWAEPAIALCHSYGIMNGDGNGFFRPDDVVTRAEFAAMVNRTFGYDALYIPGYNDHDDIPFNAWFAEDMRTAIALGFITGAGDGLAFPMDSVTGEQAEIMLGRILRDPEFSVAQAGFAPLTRGEAAHILSSVFGKIVDSHLDAQGAVFENVTIRKPGVVLRNVTIEGDLFITECVSDGDVWLDNVQIRGRLVAAGGGAGSIHVRNITVGASVIVTNRA